MFGKDVVDVILDEDPPVLVGHRVHRQARLAVRPGEEGHRGGAGVGAQEGPLALAVWGRSNTFVLRFCDEKLHKLRALQSLQT